jgi:hypothetical protein
VIIWTAPTQLFAGFAPQPPVIAPGICCGAGTAPFQSVSASLVHLWVRQAKVRRERDAPIGRVLTMSTDTCKGCSQPFLIVLLAHPRAVGQLAVESWDTRVTGRAVAGLGRVSTAWLARRTGTGTSR